MTEYIKQKRIILRDTRGNYSLGIKLPTQDYKPRSKEHEEALTKKEKNRARVKQWFRDNPEEYRRHLEYVQQWRKEHPDKVAKHSKKWRDGKKRKSGS